MYYVAFLVPTALVITLKDRLGTTFKPPRVKISGEGIALTAAAAMPTLALVFGVSYMTDFILSYFEFSNTADAAGNIFVLIFTQALIVPILEEALFRYIPIALLAPYSKRGAIIYSAAFFAFVHCNLFQLPYAFLAGVIFAFLDIASGSIMPSLALHVVNNIISLFWLRNFGELTFRAAYVTVLVSLAALSVPVIILLRKRYKAKISDIFSHGEKAPVSLEALIFFTATLGIALFSL
jgi:membrane protease YdiL (CAAX protease family)